jgi:hypothetical protein
MADSINQYMKKKGVALTRLARDFMNYTQGDRIPTIAEYADRFQTARGTVQDAMKALLSDGCVQIAKRGRLGSCIEAIDYDRVWPFTDWGVIMGAMPLPRGTQLEGLATAIYELMERRKIPFNFGYMAGAELRITALLNRKYDFIIASKATANTVLQQCDDLLEVLQFKPHSFLRSHVLILSDEAENGIRDGMRVGICTTSPDQRDMTYKLCADKQVELVNYHYNELAEAVAAGRIDAAVYNLDMLRTMQLRPLKHITLGEEVMGEDSTIATLLIRKDTYGLANLLRNIIDEDEVERIQREVMEERMIPRY